jgi:hypothetical protein
VAVAAVDTSEAAREQMAQVSVALAAAVVDT